MDCFLYLGMSRCILPQKYVFGKGAGEWGRGGGGRGRKDQEKEKLKGTYMKDWLSLEVSGYR